MIRFSDCPADDRVVDTIRQMATDMGYTPEEAAKFADAAGSISIKVLREMDGVIEAADQDPVHRTIIQQMVFIILIETMKEATKVNAMNSLFDMLTGRRPR